MGEERRLMVERLATQLGDVLDTAFHQRSIILWDAWLAFKPRLVAALLSEEGDVAELVKAWRKDELGAVKVLEKKVVEAIEEVADMAEQIRKEGGE